MNPFEQLLEVQSHDTRADQLRHRRETLPERQDLVTARGRLADAQASLAEVERRRDQLARRQRALEDEVATIEEKADHVDDTLYRSGTITSPREAQVLQDELESLRARQRALEDEVIELMEQIEPVEAQLVESQGAHDAIEEEIGAIERRLLAAEAEVDAELEVVEADRARSASGVDEGHIADYERLRVQLGGVAVARLEGGSCGGCNLMLSAVERDRIRGIAPDVAVHCEECGRLLVR